VTALVTKSNDAALGLLVGDRIARVELADRGPSAQTTQLSGLFTEAEVPDVSRFDFRVDRAITKLLEAERELCLMAVPFAVSLYNEYLVAAAEMLELAHIARPRKPARHMMLGEVESFLGEHKVSVAGDAKVLLDVIRGVRNSLVHAAGVVGEKTIARWTSASPSAKARWEGVTGRPLPLNGTSGRLQWEGPEIRGLFLVVRDGLKQVNLALQSVLPREFWADLVIHEHWVDSCETAGGHRQETPLGFASHRGYRSLGFSAAELSDASKRGRSLGWRPDLQPYWQRPIPPGSPVTQRVKVSDLNRGRLRIPGPGKALLPSQAGPVTVRLRERVFTCPYSPEPERSRSRFGLLHVGDELRTMVVPGQELSVFPISSDEIGLQ
jgi:hypothetical protein